MLLRLPMRGKVVVECLLPAIALYLAWQARQFAGVKQA
jgi:hypothetical protein